MIEATAGFTDSTTSVMGGRADGVAGVRVLLGVGVGVGVGELSPSEPQLAAASPRIKSTTASNTMALAMSLTPHSYWLAFANT